jgi:hypothetical protein
MQGVVQDPLSFFTTFLSEAYHLSHIRESLYLSSRLIYCGVFTPWKNYNFETRSRDYATVDEAVFSPCRAEPCRAEPSRAVNESLIASHRLASPRLLPGNSYKHLDNARVGKGHVTASAVTSLVSSDTTIKAFTRMSDPRVYRSSQEQLSARSQEFSRVIGSRQPRKIISKDE